jgi:hypothetical protein
MKSDKDVQLNRGRVVYRLTQRSTVIDAEEEIIENNKPEEEVEKHTLMPNVKRQGGTKNGEAAS